MTKINSRIKSKSHAHRQTMEKDVQSCIKISMNCIRSCAYKVPIVYTLSYNLRSENDKVHKVANVTKINSRIISKPHAYLQTMEKTSAKFQKDRYKIVWGVALTRYPMSIHRGRKMTVHKVEKVTKNNLSIISKPHAHPHTMRKTSAKFQKDR